MAEKNKLKSNKPTFGQRISKFFRDYGSELKKVTWSPWKDVKTNTLVVLASIAVIGVIIFVLDIAFSEVISLIGKIY
ncbi:MAG: preprotein translocase subunit SecE [Clostridia bacterium]|nr:preprotein translocase subunit SecE [Clostridia bacterium]MBR6742132.1 preprotein translocase subunit SecE [Clostridia bacterium]